MKPDQASKVSVPKFFNTLLAILVITLSSTSLAGRDAAKRFDKGLWIWKELVCDQQGNVSDTVLNGYKKAGINVLFLNCGLPYDDWEFLDRLLSECHRLDIELHPYISPGGSNNPSGALLTLHPEWSVTDIDGRKRTNLNLADREVKDFIIRQVSEFAGHNIDGLHLDYIRFDLNQNFSYDSRTCSAFRQEFGVSPLELDKDCGDPLWCKWIRWNADHVTGLVREIRTALKTGNSRLILSAAVFPDPGVAEVMIGQDWEVWVREGLLDLVCPMLYIENNNVFTEDLLRALQIAGNRTRVYAGIWLGNRYHRDVDPEIMLEHCLTALKNKADGVSFWSGSSFTDEYSTLLGKVNSYGSKINSTGNEEE